MMYIALFRSAILGVILAISAPAPAQSPGQLIDAQPVVDTPGGMQAWRIRYWTTGQSDRPIEVTGTVVAPREAMPRQPRNVIAWAHGTWGVESRCVASTADFFRTTPGLAEAIRRGYVVVAPDYPGLGSATRHGYLVGDATARSVLDAVRAARGLPGAASGTNFAVWGESQGGHAALWTGQIAGRYAPDLRLIGIAAAAPPTDLARNVGQAADPSVRAFLTAFTAYSWSEYYGVPLSTLGNRSTQGIIQRLAQNNCVALGTSPRVGTILGVLALRRSLRNVDFGRTQPWARFARDNSPTPRPAGVPFLIAQNPADQLVNVDVTRTFVRQLCRNRATVSYVAITGSGHETSAADSKDATLDWIDARFAGQAAPNGCRQFLTGGR